MVNSSYAINPGVYRNLGFSPQNDLTGVINIAFVPSVLVTASGSRWTSLQQVLDAGEDEQGGTRPSYASCGNSTPQHLAGEQMISSTGVAWLHVPIRGCGTAMPSVLAQILVVVCVTAPGHVTV